MAYSQDEINQLQLVNLGQTTKYNPLLPENVLPFLNKNLKTKNKIPIAAINELLQRADTNDSAVINFMDELMEIIGDWKANPQLEIDLHKIAPNILEAILKGSGGQASQISLDTTNFNNNLDSTITDVQKLADKVDDLVAGSTTSYSNTAPTVNPVGNIPIGMTFTTPQTMQQMWDFLLYYSPPIDNFYSSVPQGVFEIGSNLTAITLTNNITKKTNKIVKIEYYKNNMLLYANNFPNANGGMDSYTDNSMVNSNTTYYSKIYDEKSFITSGTLQYRFAYPMYIGKLDSTLVTENSIKNSLTKVLAEKSNQTFNYTMTSQYFCFAYPSSYGNLKSITDPNNFELINTFTTSNMQITTLDGTLVPYTIYLSNIQNTQMNFNVTYKFS